MPLDISWRLPPFVQPMTDADLLARIDAHLRVSGQTEIMFGKRAANNGHLVQRLRDGKSVTLATANRVIEYLEGHPPDPTRIELREGDGGVAA